MALINDVLPLIIDNVDDKATLFSLLTVNRQVFWCTCHTLYRDPLYFFRDIYHDDSLLKTRLMSLLQLLLSLSPATGDDVNLVRTALGVQTKNQTDAVATPTTMLDYLSFVQCLCWDSILQETIDGLDTAAFGDRRSSPGIVQSFESYVRSTLTWCICGHQLDQIRELEIEPNTIEHYTAMAPCFRRLRILVIATFYDYQYQNSSEGPPTPYPSAVRLVEALHQYHGKNLLRDCRFSHRMIESWDPNSFQWDADIRKLLPHAPLHDLKQTLPMRPLDSYISRVTTITVTSEKGRPWDSISSQYPGIPVRQILQHCRSLLCLCLNMVGQSSEAVIDGVNALKWAVGEACERAAGKLHSPAVTLKELIIYEATHTSVGIARLLADGLRGFALSLCSLSVQLYVSRRDEDLPHLRLFENELFQDKSLVFKRLRNAYFVNVDSEMFDHRFLQRCPNLTYLQVSDLEFNSPHTTLPSWPVLDLPHLAFLGLGGSVVRCFDPTSLHNMQRLKFIDVATICCLPEGEASLDRWTWDWDLPELTVLNIEEWHPSTATAIFKMLRSCTKLEELRLSLKMGKEPEPYSLAVLSVLPDPIQDVFPRLKQLHLARGASFPPEDLRVLLGRTLPGLKKFSMESLDTCTLQQWIDFTRHHLSLEQVTTLHPPPSDDEEKNLNLVRDGVGCTGVGRCYYRFSKPYRNYHIDYRLRLA